MNTYGHRNGSDRLTAWRQVGMSLVVIAVLALIVWGWAL